MRCRTIVTQASPTARAATPTSSASSTRSYGVAQRRQHSLEFLGHLQHDLRHGVAFVALVHNSTIEALAQRLRSNGRTTGRIGARITATRSLSAQDKIRTLRPPPSATTRATPENRERHNDRGATRHLDHRGATHSAPPPHPHRAGDRAGPSARLVRLRRQDHLAAPHLHPRGPPAHPIVRARRWGTARSMRNAAFVGYLHDCLKKGKL